MSTIEVVCRWRLIGAGLLLLCGCGHRVLAQRITPVLKQGTEEHSKQVKLAQRLLNQRLDPSPGLAADGVFGPATQEAVRRFQQQSNLDVDGVVGGQTWARLLRLSVNSNVHVSVDALATLRAILDRAGLETATVTSGVRTPFHQARVMYDNIRRYGVASQKRLYGPNGDQVIEVYEAHAGKTRDEVIDHMRRKILQLGPSRVSKHCSSTHDVIDVAPSSIADRKKFEAALRWAKEQMLISNFLQPPEDPAYHIERVKEPK